MTTAARRSVMYREVQHFTQWWLWLLIAGIAALQWWGVVQQLVFKIPFGDNPAPDALLIPFALLFGIGLPWLMAAARLVTVVADDAVYVRLAPFMLKPQRIPFGAIAACSAGKYNPVMDYGGWGIKYGRDGKALNVSGNLGVRLEFRQGRSLLIGTRHPLELATAINARLDR